jgi:hypothetical protein
MAPELKVFWAVALMEKKRWADPGDLNHFSLPSVRLYARDQARRLSRAFCLSN